MSEAVCAAPLRLVHGRPAERRSEVEERTYAFLDGLGVRYDRVDHEPAMNMEICIGIEKVLRAPVCKNLFLCNRQQTEFFLLMMPGEKTFHTRDLSPQIGSSRLSFGSAEQMRALLGVTPGSVSVFGLLQDVGGRVRLLVDRDLFEREAVGCHPCLNTSTLRLLVADLVNVILPAMNRRPEFVAL